MPVTMDQKINSCGLRILQKTIRRADQARFGRVVIKDELYLLSTRMISSFGLVILSIRLVSAVGAAHVGCAHAAETTMMAMLGRARRVIGRQIIERGR